MSRGPDVREVERAIARLPEPLAAEVRALGCLFLVLRAWRYYARVADRAARTMHRRAAIYARTREKDGSIAHALAHQHDLFGLRAEHDRALASARACEALLSEICGPVARIVIEARAWKANAEYWDPPF